MNTYFAIHRIYISLAKNIFLKLQINIITVFVKYQNLILYAVYSQYYSCYTFESEMFTLHTLALRMY